MLKGAKSAGAYYNTDKEEILTKRMNQSKGMLDMQMWLGANNKFLTRIFFTSNACFVTVPNLLKIFLPKALHMHFGKYSMFSAYSSTVNCSVF